MTAMPRRPRSVDSAPGRIAPAKAGPVRPRADEDAASCVLPRSDGAPIRLRAAAPAARHALPPGRLGAEIALWRRAEGGWAVGIETRLHGVTRHVAWRSRTLNEAMLRLERLDPLPEVPSPVVAASDAPDTALAALGVELARRDLRLGFAALAAEAMAEWSRLAVADPPGRPDAR